MGETWLFRLFLAIVSLWEIVGCDDHVDVGKSWLFFFYFWESCRCGRELAATIMSMLEKVGCFFLFLGIMSLWERVGCDDHVDVGKRLLIIELLQSQRRDAIAF